MNKHRFLSLKLATLLVPTLAIISGCQTVTPLAFLNIQDGSKSFLEDQVSVELAQDLCTEAVRHLPVNSYIGQIDVTGEQEIPSSWVKMTSRRTALGDCQKTVQLISHVETRGTLACYAGRSAITMLDKVNMPKLVLLHIQANEQEKTPCPEVWQELGHALGVEAQMVMVLSSHPLGKALNQQVYTALQNHSQVQFCKPDKAVACVGRAVEALNHLDNSVLQQAPQTH